MKQNEDHAQSYIKCAAKAASAGNDELSGISVGLSLESGTLNKYMLFLLFYLYIGLTKSIYPFYNALYSFQKGGEQMTAKYIVGLSKTGIG